MNRKIMAAAVIVLLCGWSAADLLLEEISPTYARADASAYYNTNNYLEGAYVTITNCIVYSSATASTTQSMTGLGAYFTVGNTRTSATFNAYTQSVDGLLTAVIVLPTNGYADCGVWLTLTNAAGQSYTYPGEKRLYTRRPFK